MFHIRALADRLHLEAVDQMVSLGATGASGFTTMRARIENDLIPDLLRRGGRPHTFRVEVTLLERLTPTRSNARMRVIADAYDDPEEEAISLRAAQLA